MGTSKGKSDLGVMLATHLHAGLRFRICEALLPLSMAWCLVKHKDNFAFSSLKAEYDGNGKNKN